MLSASMSMVSSISPASGATGESAPLFCFLALTYSFTNVGTGSRFWNKKSRSISALNCK